QPADPAKDKRIAVTYYGDSPAPDGSVWGSVQGFPGALVRFIPGSHPPETALAEYYEVPWNNPKAPVQGYAPRGMDVDSKGVGKDVPVATGNLSEGLLVLQDGKFMTLRVPYPMGFYAKGVDGRIDNPNGGWKGKGLYAPISTRAPFHMEGGKGTTSKLVKFQMRPDPLAN